MTLQRDAQNKIQIELDTKPASRKKGGIDG